MAGNMFEPTWLTPSDAIDFTSLIKQLMSDDPLKRCTPDPLEHPFLARTVATYKHLVGGKAKKVMVTAATAVR
jgi:hypothetical protein